jgi:hypothetical protein
LVRSAAALAAALGCVVSCVVGGLLGCVGGGLAVADRQNVHPIQVVLPAIHFIIFRLDDHAHHDLRGRTGSNTNNLSS